MRRAQVVRRRGDEQGPAGGQDAPDLGEQAGGVGDVLEHLRAPHHVDARVLERDRPVGAEQAQVRAGHVAPRALERALGQVDADRVGALGAQRRHEAPGAAPEIEHALAPPGLLEEDGAPPLPLPRLGILGQLRPDVFVKRFHDWREARRKGYRVSDMRVCFDSRPAADPRGIGRYTRCLLDGLRTVAERNGDDVVEGRQPRRGDDLFHAPWMNGALLHPRVPMVVTVHDLVSQKHAGLSLRAGLRGGMRKLAIERAARLICPTRAVADDVASLMRVDREHIEVIAEAPADAFRPRPAERGRGGARAPRRARRTTCCGWATSATPTRTAASRRSCTRRASCRSCWSAPPARGRASSTAA